MDNCNLMDTWWRHISSRQNNTRCQVLFVLNKTNKMQKIVSCTTDIDIVILLKSKGCASDILLFWAQK